MKIVCFLLIFGFIFCKDDPTVAFDIWYNYEYNLQKQMYLDYSFYVFRLPLSYVGRMDMEVKIHVNDQHAFSFRVYQYNYEASMVNILNHDNYEYEPRLIDELPAYREGDYIVYPYTFESFADGKYFGIELTLPNFNYNYIYFRVNSQKYQYSNVKELELNKDYAIDTSIFGGKVIPTGYQIYIRIPSFSQDNMEIQLTTHEVYNKYTAFQVDVCQYDDIPTESQIYYGDPKRPCSGKIPNISEEEKLFRFPFSTESDVNYLSIRIINLQQDLGYLNIYVYSETGMKIAVLVVVIVLPVLAVGAIGYFLYRKFCGGS